MPAGKSVAENARPYQSLIEHLKAVAELDSGDGFEIAAAVIDNIANATSPEEIFAANEQGPGDVADYIGQPLSIYDARFLASAEQYRKGTLGYYVVMNVRDDKDQDILLSTGAPNVVASIFQFQRLGLFNPDSPYRFVIRSRPTANGNLYTVHAAS